MTSLHTNDSTPVTPGSRLAGRTAVVTGSTSGIGAAIARVLAGEGAHVVVSGRQATRGERAVEEIGQAGGRADFVAADLGGSVAACRGAGAHFSITCGMNSPIKRAIAAIPDHAWQHIRYPTAVLDPDTGELISDAEVAETRAYTAFTGRPNAEQVTARLIVRRVRDLAKPAVQGEQGEVFLVRRHHPFFTDGPFQTLQAEGRHRHRLRDGRRNDVARLRPGPSAGNP